MQKTDILIIGSGIAGLFFAMKIAKKRPELTIALMTKEKAENTNTQFAQGGIAVVTDFLEDSFEKHIQDTLKSGGGICDEDVVRMVVCQAPQRLEELLAVGTSFDKTQSGNWDLGLEGGHSVHRILHHKDISGQEIEQRLLQIVSQLPNIKILENHMVIDLYTEKEYGATSCTGAFYLDRISGHVKYMRAKAFVLSTGGCGQLFENTTNPEIATGDGIAIAFRAGATIEDMQYIQFHPTALYEENKNPYFLISEAVRGFGAHIVNEAGIRFLFRHDLRGELATRDIVAKAITREMQTTHQKQVYLDCRHLDAASFYKHFPSITDYCRSIGLHPEKDLIPVIPVAHYQCGGIKVNSNGSTHIKNLYAVGECSRTGLHGKNRLASNSLLEALVFAHQASEHVDAIFEGLSFSSKVFIPKNHGNAGSTAFESINNVRKELRVIMTCFYADTEMDSSVALEQISTLKTKTDTLIDSHTISVPLVELTNMLTVASIIIQHSSSTSTKPIMQDLNALAGLRFDKNH